MLLTNRCETRVSRAQSRPWYAILSPNCTQICNSRTYTQGCVPVRALDKIGTCRLFESQCYFPSCFMRSYSALMRRARDACIVSPVTAAMTFKCWRVSCDALSVGFSFVSMYQLYHTHTTMSRVSSSLPQIAPDIPMLRKQGFYGALDKEES